jgi:hypothetical protein
MRPAVLGDHRSCVGHFPAHPADRGDQLSHRVLRGDRVIQHGRVQHPPGLAPQHAGLGDDLLDRIEDPVRPTAGSKPTTPIGQRRRVKRLRRHRQPTRRFPPQIERDRLHGLAIGQVVQRLQRDHRSHHIRWHTRTAPPRWEQVSEQRIREQHTAMLSQEREHTARLQQMPRHRLHIQQLPLRLRTTLHTNTIPNQQNQQVDRPAGFIQRSPRRRSSGPQTHLRRTIRTSGGPQEIRSVTRQTIRVRIHP